MVAVLIFMVEKNNRELPGMEFSVEKSAPKQGILSL